MRQIAARAGVSVVAVSCALRNEAGVSESTRARIRGIAEQLGYRPDPLLSHLMYHLRSKRPPKGRHNIAYLHWPEDAYRELVLGGARTQAGRNGYQMDVIRMEDDTPSPRVLKRMLIARGIAGLIFGPSPVKDFSELLDWDNFSTVLTSNSIIRPNFHRVLPNQFSATKLALNELTKRGYRRIGLIVSTDEEEQINSFHSAALTWTASQQDAEPMICYHDPRTRTGAPLRDWIEKHRPDSLVLSGSIDYETVVCSAIGREAAVKLGIVSLGYTSQSATMTVDYRPGTLGAIAVDQLINQLHRGERGIPDIQQTLLVESGFLVSSAA